MHHGLDTGSVKVARQRGAVVLVRVDTARRQQPDQMTGPAGLLERIHQADESGCLGDTAVRHGVADPHQFLLDHPAGADIEVPDL